jgi:arylsulfatase A-like enzyme
LQAKEETINRYKQKESNPQHNSPVYAAMIKLMDDNIGRLMKRLETLGLKENTLIVFTSDNGGGYKISRQWPLRAGKGAYYEGGIRVPMIVSWPGKTRVGRICETPVSGIDFYPTFLEAADVKKPNGKTLDGVSLISLITDKRNLKDRPLFWHFPIYLQNGNAETQDPIFRTRPGSAMRYGDWKLIEYFESGDVELYNLKNDPGEKINLAKQEPQKTSQLLKMLSDWRKQTHAPVPTELNPKYDLTAEKQQIQHLRSSG